MLHRPTNGKIESQVSKMSKLIMVLDTETTGLPTLVGKSYATPSQFEHYATARLLQLAFKVYTPDGKLVYEYDQLRRPQKFAVAATHIHGITPEMTATGIPFHEMAATLEDQLQKCDVLVGHNIKFDVAILKSEACRYSCNALLDMLDKIQKRCTMLGSKLIYGKNKKLTDLYNLRTGTCLVGAHNAAADVRATAVCYFSLIGVRIS